MAGLGFATGIAVAAGAGRATDLGLAAGLAAGVAVDGLGLADWPTACGVCDGATLFLTCIASSLDLPNLLAMTSDLVRPLSLLADSEVFGFFWFLSFTENDTGRVEAADAVLEGAAGSAFADLGPAFVDVGVGSDLAFSAGLGSGVGFLRSGILKLGPMMNSERDLAIPPWTLVIFLGSAIEPVDRNAFDLGFGTGFLNVPMSSSEERLISRSNSSPKEFDTCFLAFGLDFESGAGRFALLSPTFDDVVGELKSSSSENTDEVPTVAALSVGFIGELLSRSITSVILARVVIEFLFLVGRVCASQTWCSLITRGPLLRKGGGESNVDYKYR